MKISIKLYFHHLTSLYMDCAKSYFSNYLSTAFSVNTSVLDLIQDKVSVVTLFKGAVVLTEGQVSDKIFFICKGMVRAFYQEESIEMTSWFAAESTFIYSASSYSSQQPSYESIQLLEDSMLVVISKKDFEQMAAGSLEIAKLAIRILEHYILLFDQRTRLLRLPACERYRRFMSVYPFAQRAQVAYVASYLGLSRSTVNLIRSKK